MDLFQALHLHVRQHVVDEGVLDKVKVHQLVLGRYIQTHFSLVLNEQKLRRQINIIYFELNDPSNGGVEQSPEQQSLLWVNHLVVTQVEVLVDYNVTNVDLRDNFKSSVPGMCRWLTRYNCVRGINLSFSGLPC